MINWYFDEPILLNSCIRIGSQKYLNSWKYYFNSIRYKFYTDYFESNPNVEYSIFTDLDFLILKNPFELMSKDLEEVHFMYDYKIITMFGPNIKKVMRNSSKYYASNSLEFRNDDGKNKESSSYL